MLDVRSLKAEDLKGLSPSAMADVSARMLEHIAAQARQIEQHERVIKFKDTKLEKITFELARLKAWKFGAKTEAMSAEQRRLFEETLAEDEASLQAQLQQLQGELPPQGETSAKSPRKPRRQALPEHLRRVEHRHEPEDTTCPTAGCS